MSHRRLGRNRNITQRKRLMSCFGYMYIFIKTVFRGILLCEFTYSGAKGILANLDILLLSNLFTLYKITFYKISKINI